jgi:hypothetical protein
MRARALALLLAAAAIAGCSGSGSTPEQRTVEERERGYRFVLPLGWQVFGWEARSASGSVLTINVHSLNGADAKFVAGLPQTVIPQLEAWTLYYFNVVGEPTSRETIIGGAPALEMTYPVRIRATDPASRADYWVVRNGQLLYILRTTYPAGRADVDGPAVRELLASWKFLEATSPNAKPIGGTPPRS